MLPTVSNPDITPSFNVLISFSIAFATLIILSSIFMADFSASLNGATKLDFIAESKVELLFFPKKSGPVAVY